jgi:uracil-DNA glycosylase
MFFEQMHPTWQEAMPQSRSLLEAIEVKLAARQQDTGIDFLPPKPLVMRAFEKPMDEIRVLIVGQDPYPTRGHAIGLSFAVNQDVRPLPRSLVNIVRELKDDLGREISAEGDLSNWANQGVMLLNRHLTTEETEPAAHANLGWGEFTDLAVSTLNHRRGRRLVAILWGLHAQELARKLPDAQIISSAHPSPLSARRGFFGSKPFSKANRMLQLVGEPAIDWSC